MGGSWEDEVQGFNLFSHASAESSGPFISARARARPGPDESVQGGLDGSCESLGVAGQWLGSRWLVRCVMWVGWACEFWHVARAPCFNNDFGCIFFMIFLYFRRLFM